MQFVVFIILLVALSISNGVDADIDLHPTVTLPSGLKVEGRHTVEGVAFKGLRYAAPPVGKFRWAPA